jgi:hypothetical protein
MSELDDRLAALARQLDHSAPTVSADEVVGRSEPVRLRPRGRVLAGAGVLTAAAVLAGLFVLVSDDDKGQQVTAATRPTATSVTTSKSPPGTFTIPPEALEALDRAAMVLFDDKEMALVDLTGKELDRIPREGWFTNDPDLGVDLNAPSQNEVWTEPAPVVEDPVPGCERVHSRGGIRAAVCPMQTEAESPTEIRLVAPDGKSRVLAGPVSPDVGHWRFAVPSPDGKWVLAEWSAECEAQQAYLFDVATGKRTELGLGSEARVIGWTPGPDTRAIVGVGDGACGDEGSEKGTFLLTPGTGGRSKIHDFPGGAMVAETQGWMVNRLERLFLRALGELGLDSCCAEPSHGGSWLRAGMVVGGYDVIVAGEPIDFLSDDPLDGDGIRFRCGQARYTLASGDYDRPAGRRTIDRAADLLVSRLYCARQPG